MNFVGLALCVGFLVVEAHAEEPAEGADAVGELDYIELPASVIRQHTTFNLDSAKLDPPQQDISVAEISVRSGQVAAFEATIYNASKRVLEVNWNKSSFQGAIGNPTRLIPGTTIKRDAGSLLPPTVIPPGGSYKETLVPQDVVFGDAELEGVLTDLGLRTDGVSFTVVWSLKSGTDEAYLTQVWDVQWDRAALDAALAQHNKDAAVTAELTQRQTRWDEAYQPLERSHSMANTQTLVFGGVTALTALVAVSSAASISGAPRDADDLTAAEWTGTAVVCGVVTIPAAVLGLVNNKKRMQYKDEIEQLGPRP